MGIETEKLVSSFEYYDWKTCSYVLVIRSIPIPEETHNFRVKRESLPRPAIVRGAGKKKDFADDPD